MDVDFITWLTTEIDERGWNNSELARRAGMVPSTISMVISGHNRPSMEFCVKIATALGESPDHVLRMAGHLDPAPSPVSREDEALAAFRQIPAAYRDLALRVLEEFAQEPRSITQEDIAWLAPGQSIQMRTYDTAHPLLTVLERTKEWSERDVMAWLLELIVADHQTRHHEEREGSPAEIS